ncbi:flagellar hook-length control protein FliK [Bradyrhizobium aeschynomenes]|uniref:flagellar hook-length control protein FliK n=1 Tax=Bradyrhizobium aeschynomenes TaxID=2734909 RepID=UPI0015557D11|nr:flagellar hook-length control protein FliK [Bradyrhizobium aeschynomenes]NPV25815.1 flagellar hook-length control protein FliK [Bradyrhizobium aeschynomenes]
MVQSVTPPPSVSAVRGVGNSPSGTTVAGATTLQAGALLSARVQQVLAENLVQIAIGNLSMELASELPLQAGQSVQVAVSQTAQGLQLAIVGQGSGAATGTSGTPTPAATVVDVTGRLAPTLAPPADPLTGLERLAVSIASEEAATRQGSQGQLFADLQAVADSPNLPPALRAAVAQVLAQQTQLSTGLTAQDVQTAVQTSGLFLESSLATGNAGGPDLKAALIVLRQTLASVLQTVDPGATGSTTPSPGASYASALSEAGRAAAAQQQNAAPSLVPDIDIELPPQPWATGMGRADVTSAGLTGSALIETLTGAKAQSLTPGAVLAVLQEAQQQIPRAAGLLPGRNTNGRGDAVVRTNTPPPPFRGGAPVPQHVATPTLGSDMPLPAIAHRLLDETDQALSRQTLLQVASLPDRPDASTARADSTLPLWNFEIPFATPQGTAMAQFEISRDGGTQAPDAAKRVWRARFSLDVEPAGPVHALISFSAERTSVRMWAERPVTAARLRAGLSDLSQALSRAELSPGDLVVQDGAPPAVMPPKAGHFLDRAL